MKVFYCTLVAMVFLFSASVSAAVPGQVNFQGMLEDGAGQPVTGNVNFDFAIYDGLTGGTQLWSESQSGVAVNSGIYSVVLGSVTAITTDALSGGLVYLEITIGGEILLPRQRLFAVPYALKAQDSENFGGISEGYFQQIFLHTNYDGTGPANDDPLEGLADIDGDGRANFIDSDNDGDGIADGAEINGGSDMNLVTPRMTTISAPDGSSIFRLNKLTFMSVTGTGFIAGLSVQVGALSPTPVNVTETSFDVLIGGGQVAGVAAVTVTNSNGETDMGQITFVDKLVFVTRDKLASAAYQPVAAADAFCAQAAINAGETGSFVAWYSDPATGDSAIDRMSATGGIWQLYDGSFVANDIADLTDGSIAVPISLDEYGSSVTGRVATNTRTTGNVELTSCSGTHPNDGHVGAVDQTDFNWTYRLVFFACAEERHYYCFEQ